MTAGGRPCGRAHPATPSRRPAIRTKAGRFAAVPSGCRSRKLRNGGDAQGEAVLLHAEQKTVLGLAFFEYPSEFSPVQKALFLQVIGVRLLSEAGGGPLDQTLGDFPYGKEGGFVHGIEFDSKHQPRRTEHQLLADDQNEPEPGALPGTVDQLVVLRVRDRVPGGKGADEPDVQAEHLLKGMDDYRAGHRQLVIRPRQGEFAAGLSGDGPVLNDDVPGQPAGADAEKPLDRLGGKAGGIEFPLQGGKRFPLHFVVKPLVGQIAGIAGLPHIGLLLREMLEGIRLEVFDSLHAGKLVLVLFHIELHNFLDNGKELAVRLIHNLHADAEWFLPLDLLHMVSLFSAARRIWGPAGKMGNAVSERGFAARVR